MKKLLAISLAMFFAVCGLALADDPFVVPAQPTPADAGIDINADGETNWIIINQIDIPGPLPDLAIASQIGDNNYIEVQQAADSVGPNGYANTYIGLQIGYYNYVAGIDDIVFPLGSVALVALPGDPVIQYAPGGDNWGFTGQFGDFNSIGLEQYGWFGNVAFLLQTGDGHTMGILQAGTGGPGSYSSINFALATQSGAANFLSSQQLAPGFNYLSASQTGGDVGFISQMNPSTSNIAILNQ
jgi:hypothetical protein